MDRSANQKNSEDSNGTRDSDVPSARNSIQLRFRNADSYKQVMDALGSGINSGHIKGIEYIYSEDKSVILQCQTKFVDRLLEDLEHRFVGDDVVVNKFVPTLCAHARRDENSLLFMWLTEDLSDEQILKMLRHCVKGKEEPALERINKTSVIATYSHKIVDFQTLKEMLRTRERVVVMKVFKRSFLLVKNIKHKSTTLDDIDVFYSRPKIGGGDTISKNMDQEKKIAVIQYEESEAVDRVVRTKVKDEEPPGDVELYNFFVCSEVFQEESIAEFKTVTEQREESVTNRGLSGEAKSTQPSVKQKILEEERGELQKDKKQLEDQVMKLRLENASQQELITNKEMEIHKMKNEVAEMQKLLQTKYRSVENEDCRPQDTRKVEYDMERLEQLLRECLKRIEVLECDMNSIRTQFKKTTNLEKLVLELKNYGDRMEEKSALYEKKCLELETKLKEEKQKVKAMEAQCSEYRNSLKESKMCQMERIMTNCGTCNPEALVCQELGNFNLSRDDISELTSMDGTDTSSVRRAKFAGETVAVKEYTPRHRNQNCSRNMLYRCFHRMTSCDSRHYVKVRGVVDDVETDTHWLVMEYEERGSLRNVISTHSGRCEWTTRVDLALGVCECLQLLHDCDQQTVLGKISSHKFLVGGDGQVKVYDFDFTDLPELASEYLKNKNRSYMPPGYLSASPATYGVETECFGAGMICYEIATGKSRTEGESLPDDCPEEYQRVANGLKHQEPSKRMNIKDAVMELRNLRRRLYAEGSSCSS